MESICTSRVSKVGHTDASHKNRKPVAPMMYRKKKKKKEGGGGEKKGYWNSTGKGSRVAHERMKLFAYRWIFLDTIVCIVQSESDTSRG